MGTGHKTERDLRIDFFRGLALIFIFVDHVPDNSWALVTVRNFGFADASEVFVLLAGYSAGLCYWGVEERGGFAATFARASARAREIYAWHIGVFVTSAILLYAAAHLFRNPDYVNNIALGDLADSPIRTLAATLALVNQPNQMNILPMYIVLMLWLPFVIRMLRRSVALALVVSFAIWLVANMAEINLPMQQKGEGWYFNPLAWQLLFTTGAAVSVLARRVEQRPRAEIVIPAAAYLLFAFLVVAPWMQIPWLAHIPGLPRDLVEPMSKSGLSAWRFAHVLALGYLVAVLVPAHAAWLKRPWAQAVETCGKHSLEIFALGTLLSFFGWIALTELGSSQMTVLVVNVAGIAIMSMTAWHMSRRKQSRLSHRPQASVQAVAT